MRLEIQPCEGAASSQALIFGLSSVFGLARTLALPARGAASVNAIARQGRLGRDASPRRPLPPKHGRFDETFLPRLGGIASSMQPCIARGFMPVFIVGCQPIDYSSPGCRPPECWNKVKCRAWAPPRSVGCLFVYEDQSCAVRSGPYRPGNVETRRHQTVGGNRRGR